MCRSTINLEFRHDDESQMIIFYRGPVPQNINERVDKNSAKKNR